MRPACSTITMLLCGVLSATTSTDSGSGETDLGTQPQVLELPGRGMESAREKITDTWITAKVKSLFVYSKHVSAHVINVETMDGIVILSGSVEAEGTRDIAVDLARSVRGVRKVNSNDLLVRGAERNNTEGAEGGSEHSAEGHFDANNDGIVH